ncbi:hypothetical protein KHA94_07005 [Bacillus sp. FJAT-49705]|uniref:Uncharacterized protein n=1 Tax=Cytobacillus citreus TaxID=2833586 RepID=A0ABS5NR92_9BACI|nr:hypothetical protein [Cytobacillus citreus]MBS4189953.1 hypothetical protein [Cytobacillus citreus]
MASNLSAVKCPQCGRSAFEEFYYRSDEQFICCYRCGYNYFKKIRKATRNKVEYRENTEDGHGVFLLVNKDGSREITLLNIEITAAEIEKYKTAFTSDEIDQEKSFLATFKDGRFTIQFGSPSDNFHLSFEEYKEKMIKKYGGIDFLVPIEE